jgi:hypothetical protein
MRLQGLFYSLLRHFFCFSFQQILAIRSFSLGLSLDSRS